MYDLPVDNDLPVLAPLPLEYSVRARSAAEEKAEQVEEAAADPREALDAVKRATVVALCRLGASRRMAAAEVGCAHRTIARTAAGNPQFAAELAEAESRADGKALRLIDHAIDQEKYWRAAAWVLERRNPEEFGRRAPRVLSPDHVMKLFTRFLHDVLPQLPEECREIVLGGYDDVVSDLTRDPNAAADRNKFAEKQGRQANIKRDAEPPVAAPPPLERECPRNEAAARDWLAGLSCEQHREVAKRAETKFGQPAWDHWRKMVQAEWDRKFGERNAESRPRKRQRRERREARQAGEIDRCAPLPINEGLYDLTGPLGASAYADATYGEPFDAPQ